MALCLAAAPPLASPAVADQDDPRLGPLFERLKSAATTAESARLSGQIWRIWLESGRGEVDVLMISGQEHMAGGHHQAALADYDEVVRLAPGFAEGWNKRATLLFMIGNYDASMADIERTLALEPRHFGAISGMGLIFMALGRDRVALRAYEKVLEIAPNLPGVRARARQLERRLRSQSR